MTLIPTVRAYLKTYTFHQMPNVKRAISEVITAP